MDGRGFFKAPAQVLEAVHVIEERKLINKLCFKISGVAIKRVDYTHYMYISCIKLFIINKNSLLTLK